MRINGLVLRLLITFQFPLFCGLFIAAPDSEIKCHNKHKGINPFVGQIVKQNAKMMFQGNDLYHA